MAHLQIISSQINLDLFQNHWLHYILPRFVGVRLFIEVFPGFDFFIFYFILNVLYYEIGVGRFGLSTRTGCYPSGY